MKLIQVDERMFGPIEGLENHPCDCTVDEEDGVAVYTWTCPKCPEWSIRNYADDRPGVYCGIKDEQKARRVHHYGKCEPVFS